MSVFVILPTVPDRPHYTEVYGALVATIDDDLEIVTPDPRDSVGGAWNEGAKLCPRGVDYMFFAIDDAVPHAGWYDVARRTADAGYIPAPRQEYPDGTLESCGSMGFGYLLGEAADGTPCRNTGIIFIRREWWDEVGPFLPIHYNCDDDWNWRASLYGYRCIYRAGMRFTHHCDPEGTHNVRRESFRHRAVFLSHARQLEYPRTARAPRDLAHLIT